MIKFKIVGDHGEFVFDKKFRVLEKYGDEIKVKLMEKKTRDGQNIITSIPLEDIIEATQIGGGGRRRRLRKTRKGRKGSRKSRKSRRGSRK